MTRMLYDLAGADEALRPSPFVWRIKLALAHKGLDYATTPWRMTEKDILPGGGGKVPVLIDGARVIGESWDIASYLEATYPDRPSLFNGEGGQAHARFINSWADQLLVNTMARFIVRDIWAGLAERDRDYFRRTREKFYGTTLEALEEERGTKLADFLAQLGPLRLTLRRQPFLGGAAPSYADYIAFGPFQWARCISRFEILPQADPLHPWRERMLGLFDGLAGRAVTVAG